MPSFGMGHKSINKAVRGSAHTAGIFADMTVDGPEIGTLVVIVDRARHLPNKKSMGKQDPYCAARLGKDAKKTETDKRGGQTPKWDQELRFTVHDSPDYQKLKISVFNDDKKTELIGENWVELTDVLTPGGGQCDLWHNLQCRGRYAGEIRLELTFYDTRPREAVVFERYPSHGDASQPVPPPESLPNTQFPPAPQAPQATELPQAAPAPQAPQFPQVPQDLDSREYIAGPREARTIKRRPLPVDPTGSGRTQAIIPETRNSQLNSQTNYQYSTPYEGERPIHPPANEGYPSNNFTEQRPQRRHQQQSQPTQPTAQHSHSRRPHRHSNVSPPKPHDPYGGMPGQAEEVQNTLPEPQNPPPGAGNYVPANIVRRDVAAVDVRRGPMPAQPQVHNRHRQSLQEQHTRRHNNIPASQPPVQNVQPENVQTVVTDVYPENYAFQEDHSPIEHDTPCNVPAYSADPPYPIDDPRLDNKPYSEPPYKADVGYSENAIYDPRAISNPPQPTVEPDLVDDRYERPQDTTSGYEPANPEDPPRYEESSLYDNPYPVEEANEEFQQNESPPPPPPVHRSSRQPSRPTSSHTYDSQDGSSMHSLRPGSAHTYDSQASTSQPLALTTTRSSATLNQPPYYQSDVSQSDVSNGLQDGTSNLSANDYNASSALSVSSRTTYSSQDQWENQEPEMQGYQNENNIPSSLVSGYHPKAVEVESARAFQERRVITTKPNKADNVPPPYDDGRSHEHQTRRSVQFDMSVQVSGPQDYLPPPEAVANPRAPIPSPSSQQTNLIRIRRKSVSPSPQPEPASGERQLSGMPFSPDSYDELNPNAGSGSVFQSSNPHHPYETPQSQPQYQGEVPRNDGPIIGNDGREIDPSDHLPAETWAPEPERKTPQKRPEFIIRSRPSPYGGRQIPRDSSYQNSNGASPTARVSPHTRMQSSNSNSSSPQHKRSAPTRSTAQKQPNSTPIVSTMPQQSQPDMYRTPVRPQQRPQRNSISAYPSPQDNRNSWAPGQNNASPYECDGHLPSGYSPSGSNISPGPYPTSNPPSRGIGRGAAPSSRKAGRPPSSNGAGQRPPPSRSGPRDMNVDPFRATRDSDIEKLSQEMMGIDLGPKTKEHRGRHRWSRWGA